MQYLKKRNYLIAALCVASACAADADGTSDGENGADEVVDPDGVAANDEEKRAPHELSTGLAENTACVTVFSSDEPSVREKATGPRVAFLNRRGGTYTRGSNDSSRNISSIPSGTATIPAYEGTDADWQNLVSCVRSQYARFNVQVTDVDPGSAMHIETVVGGSPALLGYGSRVGGVSPFNCGVIGRSVSYVFSNVYSSVRGECEAVAHEIGHSLGLEHEYLCQDPMTYLSGCGSKTFQDTSAQCGTSSAVACECGNPTQNTVQKLLANVGPAVGASTAPVTDAPPTVAVSAPLAGATYARGAAVSVRAAAADDRAVSSVELQWSSASGTSTFPLSNMGNGSYGIDLRLATTAALGSRTLVVRATDDAGNSTSTSAITIQVR